jgi:two-component system, cell cycle response regulator
VLPGEPVQIAPDVWWVGARLDNDQFQCHAYLVVNDDESVLVDPGSPLTIESTMAKVAQVINPTAIKYLVCHHPDPDVTAALRDLSDLLDRPDVQVVTEWRAEAMLRHYRHRFDYYRVEEHDWRIRLAPGRDLEFQLTPYLHFPGAMVSFDTQSRTLFSSDLFGGFVPDADVLVSHDLDYIIDSARPFHQHYMPSTELLSAGLSRVQQRWPIIDQIAPQHGHVIPGDLVEAAFAALKDIDCGVFSLADADIDLKRLLRISEAKVRITEALLTVAEPGSLVTAMNTILAATHEARDCALFIDVPDQGWTMWQEGLPHPLLRDPDPRWPAVDLLGPPAALLTLHTVDDAHPDEDLLRMLADMASTVRPAIDDYLVQLVQSRQSAAYREASLTDPLTGLGNRRALDAQAPAGDYALISLDLDHFKVVNDTFGHAAGDAVLTRVARVLTGSVRDGDAVFRLGGEEFLIVLPGAGHNAASAIAERIRTTVRDIDFTGVAPGGRLTVSAGITSAVNAAPAEFLAVLEEADRALYESKDAGRDTITVRQIPI